MNNIVFNRLTFFLLRIKSLLPKASGETVFYTPYRATVYHFILLLLIGCQSSQDSQHAENINDTETLLPSEHYFYDVVEATMPVSNSDIESLKFNVETNYLSVTSAFSSQHVEINDSNYLQVKHRLYIDVDDNLQTGRMVNHIIGAEFKYENYNLFRWSDDALQWQISDQPLLHTDWNDELNLLEFSLPLQAINVYKGNNNIAFLFQVVVQNENEQWLDYMPDQGSIVINPQQALSFERSGQDLSLSIDNGLSIHDDAKQDYLFLNNLEQKSLLYIPDNVMVDRWRPLPGLSWQYQLDKTIDIGKNVDVYNVDLSVHPEIVSSLQAQGKKVICYFSVSTNETFRDDTMLFPLHIQGESYRGTINEYWVNIKEFDVLATIMRKRLDQCRDKGFNGVEFDNIDMYKKITFKSNGRGKQKGTSFRVKYKDSLRYFKWLAMEARQRGLAVGLKNASDMLDDVMDDIDFMIIEDCTLDNRCGEAERVIANNKAVFMVEYTENINDMNQICQAEETLGFSVIHRDRGLTNAFFKQCL